MKKILLTLFIIFSIVPSISLADTSSSTVKLDYSGLVQCDGVLTSGEQGRQNLCNFAALVNTATHIINWAFAIAIPVIIGLLAYSGFLHMTGKEDNIKKSYKILQNAVIGFVIMLSAWFIVNQLLKWLVSDTFTGADTLINSKSQTK